MPKKNKFQMFLLPERRRFDVELTWGLWSLSLKLLLHMLDKTLLKKNSSCSQASHLSSFLSKNKQIKSFIL